jgi:tetratricopeptide (TPR) repeat protein
MHIRHILLTTLLIAGCPKKGPDMNNPVATFNEGVRVLQTADDDGRIDYNRAFDMFSASVATDPNKAKSQYNAGYAAERMGFLDKAEHYYRQALNLDPNYSYALFNLGLVLTANQKGAEAAQLYTAYLDKNPNDIRVRNNLAEALATAGEYDKAVENVRAILRADNNNVGAYRALSRIYFSQGKMLMSQLCAEKAKTLAKGDSGIYNNIGVTYLVMDAKQAAISEFKTAIKLDPNNVPANMNLGYLAIDSGDYVLGKKTFEAALRNQPGNLDAKLGMAVAYRGLREYDNAGRLYDEVIAADIRNQYAYFNAAVLHEKYTKNFKKAAKYLDDFVRAYQGQLAPDHEVFARKDSVQRSVDAENAKKAEVAQRKQDAEVRKQRQQQVFETLKSETAALDAMLKKYGDCPDMIELGGTEQGMMILEQAQMVVQAEEVDMAADVMTFFEQLIPQLKDIIQYCPEPGAAPAPAPAEGGEAPAEGAEAPAEGGEAPAEGAEAPAEGAEAPAEGGEAPAESGETPAEGGE